MQTAAQRCGWEEGLRCSSPALCWSGETVAQLHAWPCSAGSREGVVGILAKTGLDGLVSVVTAVPTCECWARVVVNLT